MHPILHVDADAFFASVEQRDDPQLRGRPVAVGTGVVASCSYEARRWGVHTGMRLTDARRACRPLVVLPGEYRNYEMAARRILGICHDRTPTVEVVSLDDMYLDLDRHDHPDQAARLVQEQVFEEVGLNVSVGIGPSKLVSKLATKEAKQRREAEMKRTGRAGRSHVVLVPEGDERAYLVPWPVRLLPAAGPQVAARLDRINVQRAGQVAGMPVHLLCGLFGDRGRTLSDQARGIDPRPVQPDRPQQSVSRCTSFDPASGDLDFLHAMLDHLLERVISWMRLQGLATRGLGLTLRYGDHRYEKGRTPLPRATDDATALKEAGRDRFDRLYTRRLPLRLLGVELSPLQPPDPQPTLFAEPDQERQHRLNACKDAIRQRFGFLSLMDGSALVLAEQLDHDRDNFRLRTPCLTR